MADSVLITIDLEFMQEHLNATDRRFWTIEEIKGAISPATY